MSETTNILETARERETGIFLQLIKDLEGDELYTFIRRVAEIKITSNGIGHTRAADVIYVARNVVDIETALDNFYRA